MIKERENALFGEIAVQKGFILKKQLRNALKIQSLDNERNNEHRIIGRILKDEGLITDEQIYQVLGILHKKNSGQ